MEKLIGGLEMKNHLLGAACASALLSMSFAADAALYSRLGGLAYYDDVLDVTWIADANLAETNSFDPPDDETGSVYLNGLMSWGAVLHWIDAMNAANYLGYDDWRLPSLIDVGGDGCNFAFSGTDCGFNVLTGSASTTVYSELASLWVDTLGNLPFYDTSGNAAQPGWGLTNTGPFSNVHADPYWTVEYATELTSAWLFNAFNGLQLDTYETYESNYEAYVWVLRTGDISQVPVPGAIWLLGSALVGVAGVLRRKR